jgi:SPP1 family phage portal protein
MFHFGADPLDQLPRDGAPVMTDKQFIEREISRFKASRRRRHMLDGERYFEGRHDILSRQRTIIGEGGEVVPVDNLPNNRIVDNQYRKMVNQKADYLLGQPVVFQSEDAAYVDALREIFNRRFMRMLKNLAKDALNEGLGWLYPCYGENGAFLIRRFKAHEIIPGWQDADHTILEYAIRIYPVVSYEGSEEQIVEKVEVYDEAGVHYFHLDGGTLVPEEPFDQPYFTVDETPFNWSRIPLIPFRRDAEETPLIRGVKSLQDGLNTILSNFQNNMEEDARNTILILVNYDGENLGEFRRNLATYGAVKIKTVDGAAGDVKTLQVEVNAENYRAILELFKKAIIENAMGYDAKDDRLSGEPNQMNIQSMYSDIDLDANEMESEFQAGFEELLWFVDCHLANTGRGSFEHSDVEVIFNRDILINETEAIANIKASVGLLSDETLVAQHPWVDDPDAELERLEKQRAREREDGYLNNFPRANPNPPDGDA